MALNCFLRGGSMKLKACPLQSLMRGQLLKCSAVAGSSQFHHTLVLQTPLCSQNSCLKQNILGTKTVHQSGTLTQKVKQFSQSIRQMSSQGHDHTKIWTAEKALSVGLLAVVPTAFIFPCQAMDYLLATMIVMHNHWGIEAIVLDYVRPLLFGNVIPKIALGAVYLMSIATLAGLFFFITNDVGLVNAIKLFWKL